MQVSLTGSPEPLPSVRPAPRQTGVSLFEDTRAEMLHIHVPGAYNVCNFKCTYCYLPVYEARVAPEIVRSLNRIIDRLKLVQRPVNVIFATDGEVTVVPDLWPVLGRLMEIPNLQLVSLFSNCTGNFEKVLERIPASKLSVVASCHVQQLESHPGWLEKFLQTAENLNRRIRSLIVSFILDRSQLTRFPWFKAEMDRRGIRTFVYPVIDIEKNVPHYPSEELAVVERILAETNEAGIINEFMMNKTFPGLKCAAGRDYIQVDNDGTVLACWKTKQVLGNIFAETPPRLMLANAPCRFGGCFCNWTAGFSEPAMRDYQRVNSLYNFVKRRPDSPPAAFVLEG